MEPSTPAFCMGSGGATQKGDQGLGGGAGDGGQGVAGDEVADAAAGFAVARRAAGPVGPARERWARCLFSAGARDRERSDGFGFLVGFPDRFRGRCGRRGRFGGSVGYLVVPPRGLLGSVGFFGSSGGDAHPFGQVTAFETMAQPRGVGHVGQEGAFPGGATQRDQRRKRFGCRLGGRVRCGSWCGSGAGAVGVWPRGASRTRRRSMGMVALLIAHPRRHKWS